MERRLFVKGLGAAGVASIMGGGKALDEAMTVDESVHVVRPGDTIIFRSESADWTASDVSEFTALAQEWWPEQRVVLVSGIDDIQVIRRGQEPVGLGEWHHHPPT